MFYEGVVRYCASACTSGERDKAAWPCHGGLLRFQMGFSSLALQREYFLHILLKHVLVNYVY